MCVLWCKVENHIKNSALIVSVPTGVILVTLTLGTGWPAGKKISEDNSRVNVCTNEGKEGPIHFDLWSLGGLGCLYLLIYACIYIKKTCFFYRVKILGSCQIKIFSTENSISLSTFPITKISLILSEPNERNFNFEDFEKNINK